MSPGFLRETDGGLYLSVKLQPRSSANQIGEPLGDELRIKVTAPPVDSAANQALVEFLAKRLGCPRGSVELVRGQTSRHKVVRLHHLTAPDVLEKLGQAEKR
jgi:uncharacterized protein (TIGR00251 family)